MNPPYVLLRSDASPVVLLRDVPLEEVSSPGEDEQEAGE